MKKLNQVNDLLPTVLYHRNRVLFIHMPVLNKQKIEIYHSDENINDNFSSHTWNEYDDAFEKQLEKWGMEQLLSDEPKLVTRELRVYIEDWGELIKKMIKDIALIFWKILVVSLFMILVLIR